MKAIKTNSYGHTGQRLVFASVMAGAALAASLIYAQDSNRNEVRSQIAQGGWEVVWGELVNEAEYAKMAASLYAGNPQAYFTDYLDRTIAKMERSAPGVGRQAIVNAMKNAFRDRGKSFRIGKVGVKAGIATYQRWQTVIVDVPDGTERYKISGPFGSWTWGYRPKTKRVERRISLPNHHQPYVAFRIYPN